MGGAVGGLKVSGSAPGTKGGKILQVIGPVVDVEFEEGLPEVNTALTCTNKSINDKQDNLVLEVAIHLGERTVDEHSVSNRARDARRRRDGRF